MKGSTARRVAAVVLAAAFALVFVSSAAAVPAVNGVFKVPGIETNNKIVAGPDGNMWATVAGETNNVARITPAGEVKEFELKLKGASGIAVGPEGNLWVTETEGVASFSPSNPVGTVKPTSIPAIKLFHSIVAGPDGKMWVATVEKVLRFSPLTPSLPEEKAIPELNPRDIDVSGGLVAVADFGKPRLITLTTAADFGVKEISIAVAGGSQGLAGGPGGQIAFSDPGATPEQVGLVTPPNPPQSSELLGDPFGVALGADGAFWIAQFAQGGVTRLTSTGAKTFLGGLPKESPRQIAPGPGNTLWVTLEKAGEEGVARISGLEPPVIPITAPAPAPDTKIAKGPKKIVKTTGKRAKVKFRFTSTTAGATFQCALTKVKKVKKGKKAAKPQFKGCKSPKSYNLKPGRYRFSVRAVSAGVVDPSAATRSFRVVHVHKR